ncbi:hypothetical protein KA005_08640 [bacterium]|nr:hypothetical protein [bacterium]
MTEEKDNFESKKVKSDLLNVGYWVGHIFIIIATVLGVYLAAIAGFEKAIQFELVRSDRDTYYLVTALQTEVQDNIVVLEDFMKHYESNYYIPSKNKPFTSKFIWEAMKYSSSTYEIPFTLLNEIKNYYRNVDRLFKQLDQRGARKRTPVFKLIRKESSTFESDILPKIEEYRNGLKKILSQNNIKV